MNKQRKVLITTTYNEMGIIIDTKTEEVQLATDTISRQAAKLKVARVIWEDGDSCYDFIDKCVDSLDDVPTAEHERKKGKWIYGENDGQDGWFCSECGGFVPWDYDYYGLNNINFIADFKTCPFCDAKMVSYTGKDLREGEKE